MARKVKWARTAQKDLEQVAEYVSRDSERRAAQIVRKSLDAACSLALFADRGRMVPEFSDPSIRELLKGRYRLIYKISEKTVVIVAFIHGARDLPSLWKKGKRDYGEDER
jgi:plasmid stabilization system protein ParE